MSDAPTRINNLRDDHAIEVHWSDEHVWRYPCAYLRRSCECASCVHELTGQKILDPSTIPDDLSALDMKLIGNYAIKFTWSDQHSNGLYTWDYLRHLCRCKQCQA